jgi:hypothetical protein
MGIISTYAIYKYAKNRAEKKAKEEIDFLDDVCDTCHYERRDHIDPYGVCLCPVP